MKKLIHAIAPALTILLLAGCETTIVDEGPPGPQGPAGNANVFSLNFDFTMNDAIINGNVASAQFDVPAITASVVDEGAVLMFFRDQGTWTAMPFTIAVESEDTPTVDYTINLAYGYDDQFIEVFYETSVEDADFAKTLLLDQPDRQMKAVVIDGFPFGKTSIDLSDFEQVKEFFNLAD